MARSTKSSSQELPAKKAYKQGVLYISNTGCIYLYTDEDSYVMVYDPNNRSIGELLEMRGFDGEEALTPFQGSVTLTEG